MNMTEQVIKVNGYNTILTECDYHSWLLIEGNYTGISYDDKLKYLSEKFNFKLKRDTISKQVVDILNSVHRYFIIKKKG